MKAEILDRRSSLATNKEQAARGPLDGLRPAGSRSDCSPRTLTRFSVERTPVRYEAKSNRRNQAKIAGSEHVFLLLIGLDVFPPRSDKTSRIR